jgi:hypothetical protein
VSGKEDSRYAQYPVLELAKLAVEGAHRYETSLHETPWYLPLRWVTYQASRWRSQATARQVVDSLEELIGGRYQGVLIQILRSGGLPESEWEQFFPVLCDRLQTRLYGAKDWRSFPQALWGSIVEGLEQNSLRQLKPKFMMRAFVDEIVVLPHQHFLRGLCYGETLRGYDLPPDSEWETEFLRAVPLLNEAVFRYEKSLMTLTDGALAANFLKKAREGDIEVYRSALFPLDAAMNQTREARN